MSRIRSFVSRLMSGLSSSARETVDFETPAMRAMSAIEFRRSVMQPVASISRPNRYPRPAPTPSAELARDDVVDQLGPAGRQLGPPVPHLERRQRGRRKLLSQSVEAGAPSGEQERELLHARVVADDEQRDDLGRHRPEPRQKL